MGPRSQAQANILGAAYVAAASLTFALTGVAVRMAAETLPNEAIVFWRNLISLLILFPWIVWRWPHSVRTRNLNLHLLRSLATLAALYCYYLALTKIPLADAVLLTFSSPLFVPLIGFLLFRFHIDRTVIVAVLVGFLGIVLVIKPGSAIFEPAALIALLAGLFGALAVTAIWRMSGAEPAARILVYFAAIGLVVSSVPMFWIWRLPTPGEWPALVAVGALSTLAHLWFAHGCTIAPSDRANTLNYMSVVFAALLGWAIWDEQIDALAVTGAALVVVAGIIVVRCRKAG